MADEPTDILMTTTARHRKELKALQGQQRAAVKKCKTTTKGKKAKELLQAVEAEYDTKTKELTARHQAELDTVAVVTGGGAGAGGTDTTNANTDAEEQQLNNNDSSEAAAANVERTKDQQRRAKAAAKRERARAKERQLVKDIETETAAAGPPPRDLENAVIRSKLPANFELQEVAADGHCLYRAVAAQMNDGKDYTEIRVMAADTLQQHEEDFAPFIVLTDDVPDFATHVANVRSSAQWGGHTELRAISMALNRPIVVYSARTVKPLVICEEKQVGSADQEHPVRLSYHLQYYALGEHYNQVVVEKED